MQNIKNIVAKCILAIAFLIVSSILLTGFISAVETSKIYSSDAASWAQAIGVIAGIAVTIWLSYDSSQSRELEVRRQREALKAGLHLLSDRTAMLIESVENGVLYTSLIQVHSTTHLYEEYIKRIQFEVQAIDAILAGVTLDKLAETGVVDSGLYLRQAMTGLYTRVSSGFQIDFNSGIPTNETMAHFKQMKNLVKLAQENLKGQGRTIVDDRR